MQPNTLENAYRTTCSATKNSAPFSSAYKYPSPSSSVFHLICLISNISNNQKLCIDMLSLNCRASQNLAAAPSQTDFGEESG